MILRLLLWSILFCCFVADAHVPAGFEDLTDQETNLVSVYFDGIKLGEFLATFDSQTLRFHDPKKILKYLHGLKDPAQVARNLAKALPVSSHLDQELLSGSPVDVKFERSQYKAVLLIDPKLLQQANHQRADYLPDSTAGTSLINDWHATHIETVNADENVLQHQLNLNSGNTSFDLDDTLQSGVNVSSYQIQHVSINRQTDNLTYSAGFQDSFGTVLLYQL